LKKEARMRITIDTAQDSKEHIKKAIELLRSMIEGDGSSSGYQDLFSNSSPSSEQPQTSSSGSMFDIFNSPTENPSSSQGSSYPQPATQAPTEKPYKPKGPTVMGFELYE
jgi:hypothetical protein